MLVTSCLVFLLATVLVDGSRVLMIPMTLSGHLAEHAAVAEGLIKRGHEVYIVTDHHYKHPPQLKYVKELKYVHYKSANFTMAQPEVIEDGIREGIFDGRSEAEMAELYFKPKLHYDSYSAVTDHNLFNQLKSLKFDFAVCDSLFFAYHVIPFRLGIPFASLSTQLYSYILRMHPYESINPCKILHEGNTLKNRLEIFLTSAILHTLPEMFIHEEMFIEFLHENGHKDITSLRQISDQSKLWFQNHSPSIDCARGSKPNVIYIGGLAARPPTPLVDDFKQFMDASKDGVVIMSFGSLLGSVPDNTLTKLFKVLDQIPQNVIWRLKLSKTQQENFKIPSNVRLFTWIPQMDLLAHPNTKLFITHSGTNGQAEALYSAVPMIGFPTNADQPYNCYKMRIKGMSKCMDIIHFEVDELRANIQEMIENPIYKRNAEKYSSYFRMEAEVPRDKAARWIEHVIQHGGDHLLTPTNRMSVFEFMMLDICLLFAGVCVCVLVVSITCLYCVMRKCCRSHKKQKIN